MISVASLFAGCGGSSLGYRSAGFRVAYANQWQGDSTARWAGDAYELNMRPGTVLDRRDVHDVVGSEILAACGGELDVLEGSPPCQPFSAAGNHRGEFDPKDCFPDYVRLVGEVHPRAFVCENVPRIAQREHRGYLGRVVGELEGAGYDVAVTILEAEWYGVPQARRRVLILGFRRELGVDPAACFPQPGAGRSVIRDALPAATRLVRRGRRGVASSISYTDEKTWAASEPSPTVTAGGLGATSMGFVEVEERGRRRPATSRDAARLCAFPEDFQFPEGAPERARWAMIGNAVPPPMARAWAESVGRALSDAP